MKMFTLLWLCPTNWGLFLEPTLFCYRNHKVLKILLWSVSNKSSHLWNKVCKHGQGTHHVKHNEHLSKVCLRVDVTIANLKNDIMNRLCVIEQKILKCAYMKTCTVFKPFLKNPKTLQLLPWRKKQISAMSVMSWFSLNFRLLYKEAMALQVFPTCGFPKCRFPTDIFPNSLSQKSKKKYQK